MKKLIGMVAGTVVSMAAMVSTAAVAGEWGQEDVIEQTDDGSFFRSTGGMGELQDARSAYAWNSTNGLTFTITARGDAKSTASKDCQRGQSPDSNGVCPDPTAKSIPEDFYGEEGPRDNLDCGLYTSANCETYYDSTRGGYVGTENAVIRAMGSGVTTRGRAILVALCDAATDANKNPCYSPGGSNCNLATQACTDLYRSTAGCNDQCL